MQDFPALKQRVMLMWPSLVKLKVQVRSCKYVYACKYFHNVGYIYSECKVSLNRTGVYLVFDKLASLYM